MKGRGISRGKASGKVILLDNPFSFLGGVDPKTGILTVASCTEGRSIKDSVFAFPFGKGSTVGSYTILQMKKEGTAPAAMVNQKAETIVATGAVMAGVPMIDSIDTGMLRDGDEAIVDGESGMMELPNVEEVNVVTCILRFKGRILILRRSQKVSTNQGMWAGVSGYIEEGELPLDTARKEVTEETGIADFELIRSGEMQKVRSGPRIWCIHPFLFETQSPEVTIDWEHTEYRWIEPEDIDHGKTVPGFQLVLRSII